MSRRSETMPDGGCGFRYGSGSCAWGRRPDRIVPVFADLLQAGSPYVLDAGCGEGRNAAWLAGRGAMVHAVDIDAEILGRGDPRWRAHERIHWENGDIRTMRLSLSSYEGVLACNVLHWLPDDAEIVVVISRLQSVTRPGGLNGIVAFNDRQPYTESSAPRAPRLLSHEWYLDRYQAWEVLRESDMDSTHTHPGETTAHSHAITRVVARRPLVPVTDSDTAADA